MKINLSKSFISFSFKENSFEKLENWLEKYGVFLVTAVLSVISIASFVYYYNNGLGLAYNDARSHLDIGRRVVEGLNPGVAQLGSVWLPLTHILMALTVWNDFMWHSGLSGAILSMIAFVGNGALIYLFLKELRVGLFGRFLGVAVFVANINILYLQSTALTELALIGTMTAGAYYILRWTKTDSLNYLIYAAFWIMLSTLVRYDGWFLLFLSSVFIFFRILKIKGYNTAEGIIVLFCTLGGLGIALWLLWNQLIFNDALYFMFGPYSAYVQQRQYDAAGILFTRHNLFLSVKLYFYALFYNSGTFTVIIGFIGSAIILFDKSFSRNMRIATLVLVAPLAFNIIALYFGHSILFIPGISGDKWFNIRYGIMMAPSFAIFIGYIAHRAVKIRLMLASFLFFLAFFSFASGDAVTIDDAKAGISGNAVADISDWLNQNTKYSSGFILTSLASFDAVIFSSGLPMKKFIYEGTGDYYTSALENPDRWARWIVMRSHDGDSTWKTIKNNSGFKKFVLVGRYPFGDIYQLKNEYLGDLITEPIFEK